eukprot:gene18209-37024_t
MGERPLWRSAMRNLRLPIIPLEGALLARKVPPQQLALGTYNGSRVTARTLRRQPSARGVSHRGGGSRAPYSHSFAAWFGQFKRRCAWRSEWETID